MEASPLARPPPPPIAPHAGGYGAYPPPSAPPAPLVRSNSGTALAIHPRFVAAARAAGAAHWTPPSADERPMQAYEGATFGLSALRLGDDGGAGDSGGVGVAEGTKDAANGASTPKAPDGLYDSMGSASTMTTLGSAEEPSGGLLQYRPAAPGRAAGGSAGGSNGVLDTDLSLDSNATICAAPVSMAPAAAQGRAPAKSGFRHESQLDEEEPFPPPPPMPAALMYG
eukprot:TRINITY_DN1359_c0_g1_i4.p2 TRINITY_DN1359_c0_g1~~TRINITY_DN1359_c0_g1_i4.p2  ORF type:complete len:226 (-),score=42.56 TRINITY_DN1359_c0_g1_i4:196-873(-)